MSAMKRILELMVVKKASDVDLSANAVALIKINGTSVSFNNQVLGPTTPLNLLSEIVTSAPIEKLKATGDLNMSIHTI
jgi:Tfp pilus assembly pilus retraction ATPase PilT